MPDGMSWSEIIADPMIRLTNAEAEQALLGAIFISDRAFEHVVDIVSPQQFGVPVHGRIFSAIGTLIGAGTPATPLTLKQYFERDGALETVGGAAYLGHLAASAVSVVNCRAYAQTIADLARRRSLITTAQDIIADAAMPDPERPVDIVLDEAEERLFAITDGAHAHTPQKLGDALSATIARIESAYKDGGAITVDTGLSELDQIIAGMGAGDLCVLAARPAMGKSCAAGTIAFNAARRGKSVLMFSLEMSAEELAQRWIAGLTGIPTSDQRHGKIDQSLWPKLIEAQNVLSSLPIVIDDQPRLSVAQMRQRARRCRRRFGLDLIILDHLQLVRQGGKQESRRLEIGDASSMLKAIAKELAVPVLCLSQLSRAPEQRDDKRPILSDLRESGDIEQDSDVVMFLYREEYYIDRREPKRRVGETHEAFTGRIAEWQDRRSAVRGLAEIAVSKNRHGRTGIARAYFDAERQRFENLERRG